MSEKVKFHNMTRPIRFRKIRLAKQYIKNWCKAVRERIKYLFNYYLYKLNILKRYSYKDRGVQTLPLNHEILVQKASSDNFAGIVITSYHLESDIDVDYFYREKNGNKKVTLYLKNHEETRLFAESHLEDIHLNVAGDWYNVDHLPHFQYVEPEELEPTPFPIGEVPPLTRPKYKTVTYNINPLKKLTHRSLLGMNIRPEDISEPALHYYYNFAVKHFNEYLKNLTLSDIMM